MARSTRRSSGAADAMAKQWRSLMLEILGSSEKVQDKILT
jgi:hypothetical protein